MLKFCQNRLVLCSSIYIEVACSLLDSEPGFSVFSFPSWIEFEAVVGQGIGLSSQKVYQNQHVLHRSIFIEPVLASREECNVFGNLFFRIYVFREILSTTMFFCCSIYIETAQNSREQCNELADLLFWKLSLCLSRDSLSCDTSSSDLCILFKFIFFHV